MDDISKRRRAYQLRQDDKAFLRMPDYFTNFSNPQLGKQSWCYHANARRNLRVYRRGEAPISDLLSPDKAKLSQSRSIDCSSKNPADPRQGPTA